MTEQATDQQQGVVRLRDSTLIRELEGETVLLDLNSEEYYALDEVGANILSQLLKSPTLDHTVDALLKLYDVEADELRIDVEGLIAALRRDGLLEHEV